MRKLATILTYVLGVAALASAQSTVFELDAPASAVKFTLGDIFHTVHGTFTIKHGEIRFDPSTGAAGGEIIVDATSGDSGSNARDSRMKKNILEVAKYPEIGFSPDHVIGAVAPHGTSHVQVHGLFHIHGAAHEITLPADVDWSAGQMTANMHFLVPYVAWGMKNPSTLFLRVDDKVAIDIKAVTHVAANSAATR